MTSPTAATTHIAPPTASRLPEVDLLRALACLGVLLIHISGFYWAQPVKDPSLGHLLTFALVNEAVRYALFAFMFISGLLLTVRRTRFHAPTFLRKRAQTVLVPYLAWVVIYFAVNAYHNPLPLLQLGKALHGSLPHLKLVLSWLLFGTWPHLYFINMLFQMYVLYALLHRPLSWLLADRRRALAFMLTVFALYPLWVYYRFVPYRFPTHHLPGVLLWLAKNPNRLALEWLPSFACGLCCGAYYREFLAWVGRNRRLVWITTLGALTLTTSIAAAPWFTASLVNELQNYGWPRSYLHALFRLVYAVGFTCLALLVATETLARLGDLQPRWLRLTHRFAAVSFGVYLVHPLLLEFFRHWRPLGITHGFSYGLYRHSAYLYLLVITVAVTGLSYLFVSGVKACSARWKVAAWLYPVLFGR
ncbi:MAG TPA: acyltransferase [Armatimonadota bacterium]|jgi:surface polysaccharide O-acyltransferase-like enzyme